LTALGLVILVFWTVARFWLFVSSTNGGVIARSLTLPTPIPGVVASLLVSEIGQTVEKGEPVAIIHNARVDRSRLEGLRTERSTLRARLAAVRAENLAKTAEHHRQTREFEKHRAYQAEDLSRQIREAQALMLSLNASLAKKNAESAAIAALYQRQLVARLDFERSQAEMLELSGSVRAQQMTIARLEGRLGALLESTVYVESQTPVQKARIDDLTATLASLSITADELAVKISDLEAAIEAEERHVAALADAVVTSPVVGQVWRILANQGQFVSAHTSLIELIDTSSIEVEAYIHQRYLRAVKLGAKAVVSPVRGQDPIQATVRFVGSDASGQSPTVAPQSRYEQDKPMRVILSLDAGAKKSVWVGQRVRVDIAARTLPRPNLLDPIRAALLAW
jgi:multidrug resistance efflux pump